MTRTPITDAIITALRNQADEIERHPFQDITIKVQDGKVVHLEITVKFK